MEGVTKLRRKLRRMDPEATKELRHVVAEGLTAIQMDAIALAPRDTGDLVSEIEIIQSRDGMTGIVGPGVRAAEIVRRRTGTPFGVASNKIRFRATNKHRMLQFFKGYWIEFGTKGNPKRNIPPQPARPFMGPAYLANREWIRGRVKDAIARVLDRVAKGK